MGLVCCRVSGIVFRDLFTTEIRSGGIIVTRYRTASMTIALVAIFVILDLIMIVPNPYVAPAAISLGSGELAVGGFCGELPVSVNK